MKNQYYFLPLLIFLIFSCRPKSSVNEMDSGKYNQYIEQGSTVSGQAQSALLSKVSKAMNKGGTFYAVEFCNMEVADITDSLNYAYNCMIARVSEKNRNPANALETETEKQLWKYFLTVHNTKMIHDTVIVEGNQAIYYKPILTGMQTCLQCHGPEEEINRETYTKIKELYPQDKATGYNLNELRGMWKISFNFEDEQKKKKGLLTGIYRDL